MIIVEKRSKCLYSDLLLVEFLLQGDVICFFICDIEFVVKSILRHEL